MIRSLAHMFGHAMSKYNLLPDIEIIEVSENTAIGDTVHIRSQILMYRRSND